MLFSLKANVFWKYDNERKEGTKHDIELHKNRFQHANFWKIF